MITDPRIYDAGYLLGWSAALEDERVSFGEWADRTDRLAELERDVLEEAMAA